MRSVASHHVLQYWRMISHPTPPHPTPICGPVKGPSAQTCLCHPQDKNEKQGIAVSQSMDALGLPPSLSRVQSRNVQRICFLRRCLEPSVLPHIQRTLTHLNILPLQLKNHQVLLPVLSKKGLRPKTSKDYTYYTETSSCWDQLDS